MTSRLRFIHNIASPNGFIGTVLLDGTVIFSNVRYRTITADIQVKSGKHRIVFRPVNGELIELRIHLKPGNNYTVILVGLLNQPVQLPDCPCKEIDSPELVIFRDKHKCNTIRFIHGAAGVPAINITFDERRMVRKLSYPFNGCPEFVKISPQRFLVRIWQSCNQRILMWPAELPFLPGQSLTLLTTGIPGNLATPFTVIIFVNN